MSTAWTRAAAAALTPPSPCRPDRRRSRLPGQGFRLWSVSLTASPEELRRRVERDVAAGLRRPGAAEASLARLPLYEKMDTIKLDVTSLTPAETAEALFRLVRGGPKGEDHNAE